MILPQNANSDERGGRQKQRLTWTHTAASHPSPPRAHRDGPAGGPSAADGRGTKTWLLPDQC